MESVQITGVGISEFREELNKDREQVVKSVLAQSEQPVDFPADDIMKMFGWKSKRKFYKERRERGVKEVRVIGNTPTYIPFHFLRQVS